MYYTIDGSTPTQSSTSAVKTATINLTQTTTIKVFAKDADGNLSEISTKTYYIGAVPSFTVYFKPPTTWTSAPKIHYWNALPTGSVTATTWPGVAMTPSCDGWYQYTFTGVSSTNLIFNTGNSGVGTNQTADLTANGTAYYAVSYTHLDVYKRQAIETVFLNKELLILTLILHHMLILVDRL